MTCLLQIVLERRLSPNKLLSGCQLSLKEKVLLQMLPTLALNLFEM